MKIPSSHSVLLLGLVIGFAGTLSGAPRALAGVPDSPQKTLSPYFVVLDEGAAEGKTEPLPLKHTDVDVSISGIVANVEVRQTYRNTGGKVLEAIYVFPSSTRAAVHGLEMTIGDRTVEADIQEREEARETFEKAKEENRSAALLEQERPNVFKMSVGHILPGDEVEVTLHYTESLVPVERIYEFVFPTVVGPRYSNTPAGTPEAEADAWVANPYLAEGETIPTTFDIAVKLNAGMPVRDLVCDTHPVAIQFDGPDRASVGLDGSDARTGDRDYVLRYRLAGDKVASGLLRHEDEETGENYFLLTVQPPERVRREDIPGREYIFVLDTSGSMSGFPTRTATDLLEDLIDNLRPSDRFNVLFFAGGSDLLAPQSLPATAANVRSAIRHIDGRRTGGGTELTAALERALRLPAESGVSRSILVLTDGYVSFERETFEMVRSNLGEANLFSFGIGSSVNRFCIEGLARAGQGEPFVVLESGQASQVADRVRELIESPVLTDITVDFGDFEVYDVEPPSLPDVFSDRPLQVRGKYRGEAVGEVRVSGVSGRERITIPVSVTPEQAENNEALPILWARERIATLSDYLELGEDDEAKREVTNLGLTHGLLTRYTSFVAVDTEVREATTGEKETVKQPLPLPKGVPNTAVGGGSVPEPSSMLLWLLALVALLLVRGRRDVAEA